MPDDAKHILAVDDDAQIRALLTDYLGQSGFKVTGVGDGASARSTLDAGPVDLIVLDVILPDVDGVALAREIRGHSDVPIIMLTSKTDEVERIVGLEVGADDYVSKPFSPRELLARIKSIFRRLEAAQKKALTSDDLHIVLRFDGWQLDMTSRRLTRHDGQAVQLTNSEFKLLAAFLERPRRVLSRDQLLEHSRSDPDAVFDRSIDYLILRLRRKIEADPRSPQLIKTEHGAGYVFTPEVTRV